MRFSILALANAIGVASAHFTVTVASTSPFALQISSHEGAKIYNTAILSGAANTTTSAVSASTDGTVSDDKGKIVWRAIGENVLRVDYNSSEAFTGAQFSTNDTDLFYGVWEYPWNGSLGNSGVSFDLRGTGNMLGLNWASARAPFFITKAGYGVYVDTLKMGSFRFSESEARYIFNTSSLTYYVILPSSPGDWKSIIQSYTGLSARIEMPIDSGFGPTFWSDDFTQDFHEGVTNAQENYYDVVNHLYYNKIHATSMFADRPYGTGNRSYGNFDFDPKFYPDPKGFIANLSSWGFDFQAWVANRAFLYTELYNTSSSKGWLFPGIDPIQFLGPALNLSIPEAYQYFTDKLSYFPSIGVKGYKIDRGEEDEMPVYEQNIQMTLFEQLCYDSMASKWGPRGFYNFGRSAVDRSRAKTAIWNGDPSADFIGLQRTVASGIRSALMGFSQWGSDTGGYGRSATATADLPSPELWARWMHFSAYSPMYEFMLGTNHTPWYPPYPSRLVNIVKSTANEHHTLLPYIRSNTYQASKTGIPLMRALFLEAAADTNPAIWDTPDVYYFGDAFFVAPIVTTGGSRTIYFPTYSNTTAYLEYYNKTSIQYGGSTGTVNLDWEYSPVYVRAGSIVPRGDIYQGNNKWTENWKPTMTIEVYPWYSIPKTTFQYWNGNASIPLTLTTDKATKTVTVESKGDLGIPGGVIVTFYGKGNGTAAVVTKPLDPAGGVTIASVQGFEDLFSTATGARR